MVLPWSTRIGRGRPSASKMRTSSTRSARPAVCGASTKSPPGSTSHERRCTKCVRGANSRAIATTSLCAPAEREPAQKVSPLCQSSTAPSSQRMSSASQQRRGMPKTGIGGSSGWMHRRMSHCRQTGITASRKYRRFSRSCAFVIPAYGTIRARNFSTGEPPPPSGPLMKPWVLVMIVSMICARSASVAVRSSASTFSTTSGGKSSAAPSRARILMSNQAKRT